jgi:hypothetical protein
MNRKLPGFLHLLKKMNVFFNIKPPGPVEIYRQLSSAYLRNHPNTF